MTIPSEKYANTSESSSKDQVDELLHQAEEAMPYYEDHDADWREFNQIRMQLENMPYAYTFVIAGPDMEKKRLRDIKVDIRSVKGNEYQQFYEYMKANYASVLNRREMCAAACLLENIHQHVKSGIGLCVIKIVLGKYKRISVSDNGGGFYNYKGQKRLPVKDAIKFGRAYGSRYKSLGQALATSFDLWSDFASVETPHDSVIIVPEGMFNKMLRGASRIITGLIAAVGVDLGLIIIKERISLLDVVVMLSVFGIVVKWDQVRSLFGIRSEDRYFPEIRFKIKNQQEFGSVVNVYFCNTKDMKKWRRSSVERLKGILRERAASFRT